MWVQCNHKGPHKKEARGSVSEKEMEVQMWGSEREREVGRCYTVLALEMEEGAMSQGKYATSRSWKASTTDLFLEDPEGTQRY